MATMLIPAFFNHYDHEDDFFIMRPNMLLNRRKRCLPLQRSLLPVVPPKRRPNCFMDIIQSEPLIPKASSGWRETEAGFELQLDLPSGAKPGDVKVKVDNESGVLHVVCVSACPP